MKSFDHYGYRYTLEASRARGIKVLVYRGTSCAHRALAAAPGANNLALPIFQLHFYMTEKESLPSFVSRAMKETKGFIDWRIALELEIQKVRV